MQKIRAQQVASYVALPGIIPRVKELFGTSSGMLAYMIATIFSITRLLPANHPYLNQDNIKKYTVRDVFAEAGSRLIFDRKHMDQVAVFFVLILGFILFVLQFIMLAAGLLIKQANAAFFDTANPLNDIAFELMDRVFGVPGFFNSCVAQMAACGQQAALTSFPTPYNLAMQELFKYYSYGLLLVAVIIFLYYVFVVIAETAQTGTPFGKRFAHIWAPIRLVVALGLLIPLSYGYNSGQYIVLEAAKMGSGLATNAWLLYNTSVTSSTATCTVGHKNPIGVCDEALYARPNVPDSWPIVKFMMLAVTCRDAYAYEGIKDIKPYLIKEPAKATEVTAAYQYKDALEFYDKNHVIIRFGKEGATTPGKVKPYCGEIMVPTTVADNKEYLNGAYSIQKGYFDMIKFLWNSDYTKDFSRVIRPFGGTGTCDAGDVTSPGITCDGVPADFIINFKNTTQTAFGSQVDAARTLMINGGGVAVSQNILDRGWGGAGIWYNHIAEINGSFFGAANYLPTPTLEPAPMKMVREHKQASSQNLEPKDMYNPRQTGIPMVILDHDDELVAYTLHQAYTVLGEDDTFMNSDKTNKGNVIKNVINLIFGTYGLFTMRSNTDIHPLAQLVGLGKGIIDATVRNLFTATVFSFGGGLMASFSTGNGAGFLGVVSSMLVTISTITISIGFLLYYVLPFLPFMYFFFAVGSWLKTIFEAMVGVPLWALGHLRIDGHGLPGESAVHGYYLIFEIFIRPILTLLGLIGGLITFTALVKVLNQIFSLVTDNLSGFDTNTCIPNGSGCTAASTAVMSSMMEFKRDEIDQFFFTVIYTIIVYMMATSSFKMIDLLPKTILRWMGDGSSAFAAQIDDPETGMNKYFIHGASSMTSQLAHGITGGAGTLGGLTGRLLGGQGGKPQASAPTPALGPAPKTPPPSATTKPSTPPQSSGKKF